MFSGYLIGSKSVLNGSLVFDDPKEFDDLMFQEESKLKVNTLIIHKSTAIHPSSMVLFTLQIMLKLRLHFVFVESRILTVKNALMFA